MVRHWPNSFDFEGFNEPIGVEWSVDNLEVEGNIPAEIDGAFYRAGADPAHVPFLEEDTFLSGDGVVSRFRISGNQVDFAHRYVRTDRYLAEKAARRALFGAYRNPYTDDPAVAGVDRTVANTSPIWHAGRLFMTKEDGLAYEVNPETLETIGRWDYHGAFKSETMTAHVRIDPETDEMFFFGYEARGLASRDVCYCIADKDGNLVSEQWFEAPYCAMLHDFVVTENYVLFPVFPTIADLDRIKAGGAHWVHHPDEPSWVGVMPRYGTGQDIRWVQGPKGLSGFHMMNGFDEKSAGSSLVHMDLNVLGTNIFPFIRAASGIDASPADIPAQLVRWTFDMDNLDQGWTSEIIGPPGDMPRTAARDQCRPYRIGYYATYNPEVGPPVLHGLVGAGFNMLLRIDVETHEVQGLPLGPDRSASEPIHIASRQPGHEGWLAAVIDTHSTMSSQLWFFDARALAAGPIAKVKLPVRLRPQIHGTWVTAQQLETSVHN
ncbi:MAG TPA: carotenoid oxygenase family protein [Devosia sp.]|nr:carotenoid oxygenase family protein [Devosia sp.]